MRADRIGLGVTFALHTLAAVFLLSYAPARKALLSVAPIMVNLITPPVAAPPRPQPPTEVPKPRPVTRTVQQPVELPLLAAPAEAPSPIVVAPPPAPTPQLQAPAPILVTEPIFNANYLNNPAPTYPSVSRRMGEQGRLVLRVLVDASGAADEVQVRTTSGFPRLDEAARETVRRWKFAPARRGAEPVPAWVLIPISFRLEG